MTGLCVCAGEREEMECEVPLRKRLRSHSQPTECQLSIKTTPTLRTLKVRKTGSSGWKIVSKADKTQVPVSVQPERSLSAPFVVNKRKRNNSELVRRLLSRRNGSVGAQIRSVPPLCKSRHIKMPSKNSSTKMSVKQEHLTSPVKQEPLSDVPTSPHKQLRPVKTTQEHSKKPTTFPVKSSEKPVIYFTTIFSANPIVTRSRAKGSDIQTVKVSPRIKKRKVPPNSVPLSPSGVPPSSDLFSPTSKVDISIECHTKKSMGEFVTGGSSFLTSNNVVVSLKFTEDGEVKTGSSEAHDLILHPPTTEQRVAAITIETGPHDDQKKVEINLLK